MPSRNTASGLTPSIVRNSLADLPMRCVSITSWPAAEISAGGAFCCSFSEDTVSAISSRSDDWRLMVRRAVPTCVRIFCWPITVPAFFSARSIIGTILSRSSCSTRRRSGCRRSALVAAPAGRARCGPARRRFPSRRGRPGHCPPGPATRDLASRCDCISDWPVPATCWATLSACVTAKTATEPSTTSAKRQQDEQDPLVRDDGAAPQQRHRDQLGLVGVVPASTGIVMRHAVGLACAMRHRAAAARPAVDHPDRAVPSGMPRLSRRCVSDAGSATLSWRTGSSVGQRRT